MEPFSEPYEHIGARRRGINSVEQGIHVLQAVVDLGTPSSLKEIARVVGMESSQTHRYVSSLVNGGMLRQDPATGLYDLGPASLRAGLAALSRLDAIVQVEEAARGLSRRSGATVLLAVWSAGGATVIRWYHGVPPVYTMLTVGSVLPLTSSATGRVFLAFLDEALVAPALVREGSNTTGLIIERDRIRAGHIATVDNKVIPGLRAMSSPVLGAGDRVIAALTIIASDATPAAADPSFRRELLATCRALTLDLGGRWQA